MVLFPDKIVSNCFVYLITLGCLFLHLYWVREERVTMFWFRATNTMCTRRFLLLNFLFTENNETSYKKNNLRTTIAKEKISCSMCY